MSKETDQFSSRDKGFKEPRWILSWIQEGSIWVLRFLEPCDCYPCLDELSLRT
jgi:hypothetical protein